MSSPVDIKFDPAKPTHNSNVKVLRLTGIGKQNAIVIDRQDSTLDELIGQLNIDKPGAKAFRGGASMPTILQFKMAPGPNLMLPTAPSLPRSIVSGSVSHDTGFLPAVDIAFLAKAARAEFPSRRQLRTMQSPQ
jgi:hypothetical protein